MIRTPVQRAARQLLRQMTPSNPQRTPPMISLHKSPTALAALALLAFIAACAKSPDSIPAIPMTGAFDALSCTAAQSTLTAEQAALVTLETTQRQAVTGDALGVFLIGVPVSSLTGGDVSGLIGVSRGKILALQSRLLRCS